jgi:LAS superfamily LD-carboxypeptidase LdcB
MQLLIQYRLKICALIAAGAATLLSQEPQRNVYGGSVLTAVQTAGAVVAEAAGEIGRAAAEDAMDPYRDKPDIDPDDWMFLLANPWNEIGDYTPELTTLERQQFDVRIADDMEAFVQAARAVGLSVLLSSGYRSYAEQTYLFNRKVAEYGEAVAQTIVARPGTSEHQTGLCCDITDRYYEMKDRSLEDTELYQWMSEHCQEYGFIVRFPDGKEDVTGIIYEPWHFRYVGREAATYIMEHDLTLEEFLELYRE